MGASLLYRPVSPLAQFWDPILMVKRPVLICMGQPKEYTFRPETAKALDAWFSRQMNDSPADPPLASVRIGQILPCGKIPFPLRTRRALHECILFLHVVVSRRIYAAIAPSRCRTYVSVPRFWSGLSITSGH